MLIAARLTLLVVALAVPGTALADDCSNLGDCYRTMGAAWVAIGLLLGGLAFLAAVEAGYYRRPTGGGGASSGGGRGPAAPSAGTPGASGGGAGAGSAGAGSPGSGGGADGSASSSTGGGSGPSTSQSAAGGDGSADGPLGPDAGDAYRRDFDDGSYDIHIRNADGGETIDSFDADGNPTGTTTITTYPDGSSQTISVTDGGQTTVISHRDGDGNLLDSAIVRQNPDGTVTRTDYDGHDNITGQTKTNEDGSWSVSHENDDGSVTTEDFAADGSSLGSVTESVDATGRITSSTTPNDVTTVVIQGPTGDTEAVGQTQMGADGEAKTVVRTSDGTTITSGGASGEQTVDNGDDT